MLPTRCPAPRPLVKDSLLSPPRPRHRSSRPPQSSPSPRELSDAMLALLGGVPGVGGQAVTVTSGGCSREDMLRRDAVLPSPRGRREGQGEGGGLCGTVQPGQRAAVGAQAIQGPRGVLPLPLRLAAAAATAGPVLGVEPAPHAGAGRHADRPASPLPTGGHQRRPPSPSVA